MRILYVTNGFPYPLTSGYLRHYFFIRELAQFHRITLLSVVGPNFVPQHAEALAPYTERVLTFAAGARGGTRRKKIVTRMMASLHGRLEIRQMGAAVAQLAREDAYDAVVFSGKHTYRAIAGLSLPPIVADVCDATSMRLRTQLRYSQGLRRAALWLECHQVRLAEQAILARADHVVFASFRDRQEMPSSLSSSRATVLPNGIDVHFWRRTSNCLGVDTIAFTGAMNYAPNVDAALYLINDIFPLVRRAVPHAKLLIVGHNPAPELMKVANRPGVIVTGFVDDVRPHLERAAVFVAPIRFAAGIQNKLLEALAMELPAVTSSLAADGLRTEDGAQPPVQIAETPRQYAEAIVQQLALRRTHPAPVDEGRRYVERHFSWTQSGERLNRILENAVRARATARVA